jgi:poly(3-hydroxybutyrate) depolymerase
MSAVAYAYVPTQCAAAKCSLHVAFHGCRQNVDSRDQERVHDDFIRDAGYNRWAAANNLVVLYPQLTESALNPNRCWDFWGYSGSEYYAQQGPQMRAVKAMVDRLLGTRN